MSVRMHCQCACAMCFSLGPNIHIYFGFEVLRCLKYFLPMFDNSAIINDGTRKAFSVNGCFVSDRL